MSGKRKMKELIHFIVLISILTIVFANKEVETTHGRVSGRSFKTFFEEKKYQAFMGIPFAAPPVKEFRFKVIYFFYFFWKLYKLINFLLLIKVYLIAI